MSSGLSIKNDQAVTALRRLATYYGTNCTQAIIRAGQEILDRPDEKARRARLARMKACVDDLWTHASGSSAASDDDMYDEDGLPRW